MDQALFDRVYETYGPALYRFCLLQMKNPADAEDVLQDVFVKRLYQAPKFKSPEHERSWLYQVALNLCRDQWRRSRRSELPLEAAAGVSLPPEELSLLDQVSNLPEKQRTVLHLHYYQGYSTGETAELMGQKPSTVRSWLCRARRKLKDLLEEDGEYGG